MHRTQVKWGSRWRQQGIEWHRACFPSLEDQTQHLPYMHRVAMSMK